MIKLIRDKIGERIAAKEPTSVHIETEQLPFRLATKLFEESREYLKALTDYGFLRSTEVAADIFKFGQDRRLEELADLYEIIDTLARLDEVSMDEVAKRAGAKRQEKGGFEQGFMLFQKVSRRARREFSSIFMEKCVVSASDNDLQITIDGRERGLWFWIRDEHLFEGYVENAVLLDWKAVRRLRKAINAQKEPK